MRTRRILLLAAIVLAGAAVRIAPMTERPLWYDEVFTWHVARPQTFTTWLRWQSLEPKHPPGSFAAVGLAMRLTGSDREWVVRLPSVAAGILLLPSMYALGTLVGGPATGLIAAAMSAFAPNMVDQGQQARMFAMLALLEVLSLVSALVLLRRASSDRSDPGWGWVLLGILLGSMLWINQLALAVWAGMALGVLGWLAAGGRAGMDRRYVLGRCSIAAAVAAVVSALGIVSIVGGILAGASLDEGGGVGFARIAVEISDALIVLTGSPAAAIAAYALAATGLIAIWRRERLAGSLLTAVAVAALLILFPLRQRHPFLAVRFLSIFEPIVWTAVAAALAAALASTAAVFVRTAAAAGCAALIGSFLYVSCLDADAPLKGTWDLPRAVVTLARSVDREEHIVYYPAFNQDVGYYYGLKKSEPIQDALRADPTVENAATLASLQRPPHLWMIASSSKRAGWQAPSFLQQLAELRALATWYGVPDAGRQAVASLRPGDTFIARIDDTNVALNVTARHGDGAAGAVR